MECQLQSCEEKACGQDPDLTNWALYLEIPLWRVTQSLREMD